MSQSDSTRPESASFTAFRELANQALGFALHDDYPLLPLATVLSRIENLYSQDVGRFEVAAARLKLDEGHYRKMTAAVEALKDRLVSMGVPHSKVRAFETVAIEPTVFLDQTQSDAHLAFRNKYGPQMALNQSRGHRLFDFMLAHSMQCSEQFKGLNRATRSLILSSAASEASRFSIWESNNFGAVWTAAGATLPRIAYAVAVQRLIDALYSAMGFSLAYDFFEKYLNPLTRFPLQLLYSAIMNDPKTLLQEYLQEYAGQNTRYDVSRLGGSDHEPEFHCTVAIARRKFDGRGDSKSRAEVAAARKAVEFLLENDRHKLPLIINRKISAGVTREDLGYLAARIAYPELLAFRQVVGASCSDGLLRRCFTLKADIRAYGLSASATNELMAFCGSSLALAIKWGKSLEGSENVAVRPSVLDATRKIRTAIFVRSTDRLGDGQILDVIQAVMYAEFLTKGYEAAATLFDRCLVHQQPAPSTDKISMFDPLVPYTQLLQEFTQERSGVPEYLYVLLTPQNQSHAPMFRCIAKFDSASADGQGTSKKAARQIAAFHLLQKLKGGEDDTRTP